MATLKQELRTFYVNQGLKPQEIRKAMRYDLRSIRKQCGGYVAPAHITAVDDIHWHGMAEGPGYWLSRHMGQPSVSVSANPLRVIR